MGAEWEKGLSNKIFYIAAIKRFYEPERELNFDELPLIGERYLRVWNMSVPVGHSIRKRHKCLFRAKMLSDLLELNRSFKFMINLKNKLYKEKLDGTIDVPWRGGEACVSQRPLWAIPSRFNQVGQVAR